MHTSWSHHGTWQKYVLCCLEYCGSLWGRRHGNVAVMRAGVWCPVLYISLYKSENYKSKYLHVPVTVERAYCVSISHHAMQVAWPNTEFQLRKLPVWPQFSNSNHWKYTVTGGPQYCDHLRPAPEESVRWYAQRASGMCMCMSPRARWKMVHCSYLYVLSVTVVLFIRLPLAICVVRKACTSYTSLHNSYCSL